MKTSIRILLGLILGLTAGALFAQSPDNAQPVPGRTDSSAEWGSGWLDLKQPTDFHAGDVIFVQLGGTAKKVVVRLLPKGEDHGQSTGVVGGPRDVPQNRMLKVILPEDRLQVTQISVHGGSNPWNEYPLGDDNGPATVASVSVVRKQ